MWEVIAHEVSAGIPSWEQWVRASVRIVLAGLLGAVVGLQREAWAKPAGLRTHMLVALGSALFVLVVQQSGGNSDALARVIQGLVAGIGFLGAGAILNNRRDPHIRGLTTAAGVWMTAAIGVSAGIGRELTAILATILGLVILGLLPRLERRLFPDEASRAAAAKRALPPNKTRGPE